MAEESVTGLDGTYEPTPPPLLADPLSGLVTGVNLPAQRRDDVFPLVVPKPPDPDELREAVDAALLDEEPAPPPAPEPPPPAPTPAAPSRLRQWPAAAAVARKLRATKQRIQAPPAGRKPAGMRSGMAVVIVIVLVTVVILYYVITSLVHTFSQLFG